MPEFLQVMENWGGYVPVGSDSQNDAGVASLINLIANTARMPAHRRTYLLQEVITTSDFPTLFGTAIDREMLARWKAIPEMWRAYCKVGNLPNFNVHERHKVYGQDNLLPEVVEKGEYLVVESGTGEYNVQLKKYGRQFDISFEAVINDAMGAFSDLPSRFAVAASRSVSRAVTSLYAGVAAPNAGLYGAPIADVDGQNVVNLGVLPLTIANLETTLALMSAQTDPNGEPILVRGVHLVVPPALEFIARSILTSALKAYAATALAAVPLPTANVVAQYGIQLHVDPYLPIRDLVGGNWTWYVFGAPAEGAAIEMNFLSGYEQPEICMKASDKVALGGIAAINAFTGDFATDNIFYRVRHIFGGTPLDPRYTYSQVATQS